MGGTRRNRSRPVEARATIGVTFRDSPRRRIGRDYVVAAVRPISRGPWGLAVAVLDPPIVTTKDAASARLGKAEGRDVLEVDLKEEAAARLRAYSASHVGAQLAFVVDGRVRQVGRVLDPIVGTGIIVDPGDSNEAAALVSSLRDGDCATGR